MKCTRQNEKKNGKIVDQYDENVNNIEAIGYASNGKKLPSALLAHL